MEGSGHSIVIIDDDAGMSQAIERLLMAAGWHARAFSSAESFLGSPFKSEADLLVLDIQLPGMSGPELHLRMTGDGVKIPVIYITGQDHPYLRDQAEKAGAAAYLTKPFAGQQLIEAISKNLTPA